jgi:hypothetical protein
MTLYAALDRNTRLQSLAVFSRIVGVTMKFTEHLHKVCHVYRTVLHDR